LILRKGLGAESLAWSMTFVLLPLACVYYPVSILPHWLQWVAWALPPTYVFEGMRAILLDGTFRGDLMVLALLINAAYLCAAVVLYLRLLDSARIHGSLLQSGE
jgi:ABC-2 type transport system permease protein